jgi:hypothetical protein
MLQNKNHRDAVPVLSTNSRIQSGRIVERRVPASGELGSGLAQMVALVHGLEDHLRAAGVSMSFFQNVPSLEQSIDIFC